MSWEDLLESPEDRVVAPWTGSRAVFMGTRMWIISGPLPPEHGWYSWTITSKKAMGFVPCEPPDSKPIKQVVGYLVGDRMIPDDATDLGDQTIYWNVCLLDIGLDRFVRVRAGRYWPGGPLVFMRQEMDLGPEDEVRRAFIERRLDISAIKGITPALEAAFRFEWEEREAVVRRREEAARRRAEEEAKREKEAKLAEALKGNTGAARRELAKIDFAEAARRALAIGGAEFLDSRPFVRRGEFEVTFRFEHRQFQCITDAGMRIVDAGICLQDHRTGRRDDTLLTLESLPAVIAEAVRLGKLVVLRHAGDDDWREDT